MPKPKRKPEMVKVPLTSLVRWTRMAVELDHSLNRGSGQQAMANYLWMDIMCPMPKSGHALMKKLNAERDNPFA